MSNKAGLIGLRIDKLVLLLFIGRSRPSTQGQNQPVWILIFLIYAPVSKHALMALVTALGARHLSSSRMILPHSRMVSTREPTLGAEPTSLTRS